MLLRNFWYASHTRIQHIFLEVHVHKLRNVRLIQSPRAVKITVLHLCVAFARNCFFVSLVDGVLHTQNRQLDFIADQVRITAKFDELRLAEVLAELTDESPLNHGLILSFVVEYFDGFVRLHCLVDFVG